MVDAAIAGIVPFLLNVSYDKLVKDGYPLLLLQPVLLTITLYLAVIYSGRQFMKDRMKYELKVLVPLHNFILCGVSILMGIGVLYELFGRFIVNRLEGKSTAELFLCDPEKKFASGRIVFWYYIFYLSKFYELFDTIIIVLKKRPIIFLHVYHHCITIVLIWAMLRYQVAVTWISTVANVTVHIPMYYYYGISAMGKTVWWKKYITMFQITQFVADLVANSLGFVYIFLGYPCSGSVWAWTFGQAVLLSFLVLFLNFFENTYKSKSSSSKQE